MSGGILELFVALAYSAARMFIAYLLSVASALLIGIPMGRSEKLEKVLYPIIDVLQSVPILGFFPFVITLTANVLPPPYGIELASILLIFTSQAWNMILGVYASVKFIPPYILDMAKIYRLNLVAKLTKIYIPASIPAISKNSIISWAGGLFFLVSSEIIALGSTNYALEGIGTYVQMALESGDMQAVSLGIIGVMFLSILTYILIWNPMYSATIEVSTGTEFVPKIDRPFKFFWRRLKIVAGNISDFLIIVNANLSNKFLLKKPSFSKKAKLFTVIVTFTLLISYILVKFAEWLNRAQLEIWATGYSSLLIEATEGLLVSLLRITVVLIAGFFVVLAISYLLYEKTSIYRKGFVLSGEVLSSIPASLWWPIFISMISLGFPPELVSMFIIFQGAIWYIFFNIALTGVGQVEKNIMEMAKIYKIKGRYKFFNIYVPMLTPFVLSGASSAWGGAWNATIVAEYAILGNQIISLFGIGYLISEATYSGNSQALFLYILILTSFIVVLNRTLWAWLYSYAKKKYHIIE